MWRSAQQGANRQGSRFAGGSWEEHERRCCSARFVLRVGGHTHVVAQCVNGRRCGEWRERSCGVTHGKKQRGNAAVVLDGHGRSTRADAALHTVFLGNVGRRMLLLCVCADGGAVCGVSGVVAQRTARSKPARQPLCWRVMGGTPAQMLLCPVCP